MYVIHSIERIEKQILTNLHEIVTSQNDAIFGDLFEALGQC